MRFWRFRQLFFKFQNWIFSLWFLSWTSGANDQSPCSSQKIPPHPNHSINSSPSLHSPARLPNLPSLKPKAKSKFWGEEKFRYDFRRNFEENRKLWTSFVIFSKTCCTHIIVFWISAVNSVPKTKIFSVEEKLRFWTKCLEKIMKFDAILMVLSTFFQFFFFNSAYDSSNLSADR